MECRGPDEGINPLGEPRPSGSISCTPVLPDGRGSPFASAWRTANLTLGTPSGHHARSTDSDARTVGLTPPRIAGPIGGGPRRDPRSVESPHRSATSSRSVFRAVRDPRVAVATLGCLLRPLRGPTDIPPTVARTDTGSYRLPGDPRVSLPSIAAVAASSHPL